MNLIESVDEIGLGRGFVRRHFGDFTLAMLLLLMMMRTGHIVIAIARLVVRGSRHGRGRARRGRVSGADCARDGLASLRESIGCGRCGRSGGLPLRHALIRIARRVGLFGALPRDGRSSRRRHTRRRRWLCFCCYC